MLKTITVPCEHCGIKEATHLYDGQLLCAEAAAKAEAQDRALEFIKELDHELRTPG